MHVLRHVRERLLKLIRGHGKKSNNLSVAHDQSPLLNAESYWLEKRKFNLGSKSSGVYDLHYATLRVLR